MLKVSVNISFVLQSFHYFIIIQSSTRRGLVVKALDSHARGCGFKSYLSKVKTIDGGR